MWSSGPGRLRRVGARAVGRAAADQPRAAHRARAGVGQRRGGAVGVERGRRRRGRAAGAVGLDGARSCSRCCRSPATAASRSPCCAGSSCWTSRSSAPGCTPPRTASTRPRSTAPSSATSVLAPGWTSYPHRLRYQTYDVTGLLAEGRQRDRRARWPTAGTAATSGFTGKRRRVRRPHRRRSCSWRSSTPTAAAPSSTTDDDWRVDARTADPGRPLQGRDGRLPPRTARLVGGRRSTTPAGRRSSWGTLDAGHAGRADRPAGAPHRGAPGAGDHHLAVGEDPGRLRPEPGRPDPVRAARRPGRHGDHRPARRGARARRARHAAAARGRRDRRHRPRRPRAADVGAAVHLPRLPLRRGRRLAGRADRRTPSRRSCVHTDLRRTGTFTCSDPDVDPAARERRLGHARQLPRRPDRLPAARRAAGLDRRPRRSSRRRRRSSTTPPACSAPGWPTSRSSSWRTTAGIVPHVRAVRPAPAVPACRPTSAGATPPSSSRGCCTSAR